MRTLLLTALLLITISQTVVFYKEPFAGIFALVAFGTGLVLAVTSFEQGFPLLLAKLQGKLVVEDERTLQPIASPSFPTNDNPATPASAISPPSTNGTKDEPSLEGQLQNRRDQEKAAVQKEAQEKNVEPELVQEALQQIDQRYRTILLALKGEN